MSDIRTKHVDYSAALPGWKRINDIVKLNGVENYLVKLNPSDTSEENTTRNKQYRERAIFYALASQTVTGMLGTVFKEWPSLEVPEELSYLNEDCDGSGVSIFQQSQEATASLIAKARGGLFVSFPKVEGQVSKKQMLDGEIVATIHFFEPEMIINWKAKKIGSKNKLSLVVLFGKEIVDDGYATDLVDVYTELFLDENDLFCQRTWRDQDGKLVAEEPVCPVDGKGKRLSEIPFTFLGAENNDARIDFSRLSGIVELNIGHYRNSADYEDSVFYSGQAQPWMSGITQEHINALKTNNMYVGSRNLLGVPEGGTFGFASAPPNPLVRQAMIDKVDQMVSLGARMMQQGSAVKTATQAAGEIEVQHSVLSLIASNISEAYTKCLFWVALYMGTTSTDGLNYIVRQDYVDAEEDPAVLKEVMTGFLAGSIPVLDYVRHMKKAGHFDEEKSDDDYAAALKKGNVSERISGIDRFIDQGEQDA